MTRLRLLLARLARKTLQATTTTDYSLKKGDIVTVEHWSLTTLEVVDVNWALMAVALRLGPNGAIVVWPVWNLRKVSP